MNTTIQLTRGEISAILAALNYMGSSLLNSPAAYGLAILTGLDNDFNGAADRMNKAYTDIIGKKSAIDIPYL